jgi:hypothetical protein
MIPLVLLAAEHVDVVGLAGDYEIFLIHVSALSVPLISNLHSECFMITEQRHPRWQGEPDQRLTS